MKFNSTFFAAVAAAGVLLLSGPALAHHPLAGMPMETFAHGLLSGVGHPILGFDHLFFVIAVGVAAVVSGRALLSPLFYVAGMLGGVALCVGGVGLPMVEAVIAFSLLAVGGVLAAGAAASLALIAFLFAGLGLFHGWAFGESLAAQEGGAPVAVFVGYLLGLAATQYVIAVAAGWLVGAFGAAGKSAWAPRLTGAAVAGAGCFLLLEALEGAAFSALGLS